MPLGFDNIILKNIRGIFNINWKTKRRAERNDRKYPALVFKLGGKTEYYCDGKKIRLR